MGAALDADELTRLTAEGAGSDALPTVHGLVVVGSHVATTTRQLEVVRREGIAAHVTIDVGAILSSGSAEAVREAIDKVLEHIHLSPVVVATTRDRVDDVDPFVSLAIARGTVARVRPAYVVGKGGITSSDVAIKGLNIRRARVQGTVLPGIVSVWRGEDGAFPGMPYVVFAGNVGSDTALRDVIVAMEGGA